MKVMVIVKATAASEAGELPTEELMRVMGEFNEALVKAGIMEAGEGLKPSSQGARIHFSGKQRTVVDGPFAETKELIAGFWIWRVNSLEEAIEWGRRCPNPHDEDCHIEIRPIYTADDFGDAYTPELREQEAALRAATLGLPQPQFVDQPERRFAGLNRKHTQDTLAQIPAQWAEFSQNYQEISGQLGPDSFGVTWNTTHGCQFDYVTGIELQPGAEPRPGDTVVTAPAGRYAVFPHRGNVSKLPEFIDQIWTKWVPDAEVKIGNGPCFECYPEHFDPVTGEGGTDYWLPLAS